MSVRKLGKALAVPATVPAPIPAPVEDGVGSTLIGAFMGRRSTIHPPSRFVWQTAGMSFHHKQLSDRLKEDHEREAIWKELISISSTEPLPVWNKGQEYYLFKEHIYKPDRNGYSTEELMVQILDADEKERRRLDRLKHKFGKGSKQLESEVRREGISEEVRIAVWQRDAGKCCRCGSRERLEYDHIIPVSLGGSNTARNIELLCESCNRAKSNRIE